MYERFARPGVPRIDDAPPLSREVDVRLPEKKKSELPWREAGPSNYHDYKVDLEQ